MARRSLSRLLWLLIPLGLLSLVAYGFWPAPLEVEMGVVERGNFLVTVDEDGKTRIREKYTVSIPVPGNLLRLALDAGDAVVQDKTVLARIEPLDPTLLDARALAEAEARVRAAEAVQQQASVSVERAQEAEKFAGHEFERAGELVQQNAISTSEFDRLETEAAVARADVRAAEFALRVATFELELARAALIRTQPQAQSPRDSLLTIRSPITGQVLRVFQESAGVVTQGLPLIELGDPGDLEVEIDVLSSDAVRITPGARVVFEQWGGDEPLEGVVRVIEPAAFTKISALGVEEQRVNIIADFRGPAVNQLSLGDGYRVEAKIVTSEAVNVNQVSTSALFREQEAWHVYRVEQGVARRVNVQLGRSNGLVAEVLEGLATGDQVVMHPTDRVRDGVRVVRLRGDE